MDPLSATLAVLAFATALKDTIEVCRKIQDAFSKLPANQENAQKLVRRITRTLEQMEATYNESTENCNIYVAMKESLHNLKDEMTCVLGKCQELIPPVRSKKSGRFVIAIYNLRRRHKVERLISELKEQVNESMELFFRLSTMRTEKTVMQTDHSTTRIEHTVTTIDRTLKTYLPVNASATHMVPVFLPFNHTHMTWIPGNIPEHELSKAYLRRELRNLEHCLRSFAFQWFEKLRADLGIPPLNFPLNNARRTLAIRSTAERLINDSSPSHIQIPPLNPTWSLEAPPISTTVMHRCAVIMACETQNYMEFPTSLWVYDVDNKLCQVNCYLEEMQLHEDSVSLNTLRVDLWTALAAVYPESPAAERLAYALKHLSRSLSRVGQREQAHLKITQALANVDSLSGTSALRAGVLFLRADILGECSRSHQDPASALQLAHASVRQIEIMLGINGAIGLASFNNQVDDEFLDIVNNIIEDVNLHDRLFTYATLIFRLTEVQLKNGQILEPSRNEKRALIILKRLSRIYPRSSRILRSLSSRMGSISYGNPALAKLNTAAENMEYTQDRIKILTKLIQVDPQRYVLSLLSALHTKQHQLLCIGNYQEVQEIYDQMVDLGTMTADPYPDVKIPSDKEGDYYLKLARYHFFWERKEDAINAAKNAVSIFSALEMMTPGSNPAKHFSALVLLSKYYDSTHRYDLCITLGFRALHLLDRCCLRGDEHAELATPHMELLQKMMEVLGATSDSQALAHALRDVSVRIEKLFHLGCGFPYRNTFPPSKYVSTLQNHNLHEEAVRYLEDTFGRNVDRNTTIKTYLEYLLTVPNKFKAQGDWEMALKSSQQAMDIAEGFFSSGFKTLKAEIYSKLASAHIYLLYDTARYSEALALSDLMVAHAREVAQAKNACCKDNLIWALARRTDCLLLSLQPQNAIATVTEAICLCNDALSILKTTAATSQWLNILYVSLLLGLASGLGDIGDMDQAFSHLEEAEKTLINYEKSNGDEEVTYYPVYSYYRLVQTLRARLLFTQGKHMESASIIEGLIHNLNDRELAEGSKLVNLILIHELQFAGILYCTLGRHADGSLAAAQVAELKRSLRHASGHRELLDVQEKSMTRRGLWKPIQGAKDKLDCHHQDSILGL